jgi:predicted transcriptional regulator
MKQPNPKQDIYTLTRVGRKHMTQYQLWQSWIEE